VRVHRSAAVLVADSGSGAWEECKSTHVTTYINFSLNVVRVRRSAAVPVADAGSGVLGEERDSTHRIQSNSLLS
jgi:hypothetical protein